jgi:hypothetical protein
MGVVGIGTMLDLLAMISGYGWGLGENGADIFLRVSQQQGG